jgi:hypothetical protein
MCNFFLVPLLLGQPLPEGHRMAAFPALLAGDKDDSYPRYIAY